MSLVSIIIPTLCTNLAYLEECLVSISHLQLAHLPAYFAVEVVVVCNTTASEMDQVQKKLESVVSRFRKHSPVKLQWLSMGENKGFVGAVNAGITATQGKYVVLLNDDVQVTPLWLSELVRAQEQTQADMVASTVYLGDRTTLDSQGFGFAWRGKAEALKNGECSLSGSSDYWLANTDLLPKTKLQEPFGPDGAAALYTRELFDAVGLLSPDFFAYLEDVELALRARQQGMSCVLADKAVVYHYKHATSIQLSGFKSRQDLVNWGRIVLRRFTFPVWQKFAILILVERLRNVAGYLRSWS